MLNNTLLNNQEITGEIKEEIKKYLITNDNENATTQNLWDEAKTVVKGKFRAIQLLEENTNIKLLDIGLGSNYLNMTLKAQTTNK